MLKKARRLTHPTQAVISPSRPVFAKTDSLPWGAPCPKLGRSERRGEEVHTALCVDRSPCIIDLGERTPSVFPISEKLLLKVESLSDARTPTGERRAEVSG